MLNWAVGSVKFLGVEFDQSGDEEVAVSDTTHLRAEDLDFRVECLGGEAFRVSGFFGSAEKNLSTLQCFFLLRLEVFRKKRSLHGLRKPRLVSSE